MHDLKLLIWTTDPIQFAAGVAVVVALVTAAAAFKFACCELSHQRMFRFLSRSAQRAREQRLLDYFKGEADNGFGCVSPASGDAARSFVAESHGDALTENADYILERHLREEAAEAIHFIPDDRSLQSMRA